MKKGLALLILLGIPAFVAAQGSCVDRTSPGARAERAAPAATYPAFEHWLMLEPQIL